MSVSCQFVLQKLRAALPPRYALSGDATGLQVGTADKDVDRVLCTLDLTEAVAQEAREWGAGLVVSHHAVVYRPLKDLRTDHARGRILEILIKNDIAVYVPHTALDVVESGLNDWLGDLVGLQQRQFVKETGGDAFVLHRLPPNTDNEAFSRLYASAAASSTGVDTLEAVVPLGRSTRLAERVQRELGMAPQIVPLSAPATTRGIGRVGTLRSPKSARQLALLLKKQTRAPGVRIAGPDPDTILKKVAVCCGDGRSFIDAAIFAGAEAVVTGDIDHHTALDAIARGVTLLDVGHWASESNAAEILAGMLNKGLDGKPVKVKASAISTQPFFFV